MLSKRIISALIGILLLILFVFWSSLVFFCLILVLSSLAIYEYNQLLYGDDKKNLFLLLFFNLFILLFSYSINRGLIFVSTPLIIFIAIFSFFTYHIFSTQGEKLINTLSNNILGLIYISGAMAFLPLLRDFSFSFFVQTKALWLVLIATWAVDTGAYFTGIYLGKNKLASNISPNKTIEGAIGGIMFSVILVSIYLFSLQNFASHWVLYGILVAILAILGDLFESSLKRDAGIKDSGTIIPGHGGVLDRFDSLIFTAPFTYFYLFFFL